MRFQRYRPIHSRYKTFILLCERNFRLASFTGHVRVYSQWVLLCSQQSHSRCFHCYVSSHTDTPQLGRSCTAIFLSQQNYAQYSTAAVLKLYTAVHCYSSHACTISKRLKNNQEQWSLCDIDQFSRNKKDPAKIAHTAALTWLINVLKRSFIRTSWWLEWNKVRL